MQFDLSWFLEIPGIIITVGVILVLLSIALIAFGKKNTSITIIKNNNPEDLKKFMEQHNFPEEMIQNMTQNGNMTNVTTTQTTRTVKYVNGQLVSDETQSSSSNTLPFEYCPKCGAKVEPDNNGICRYCNTPFNAYRINQ
ncbi:MAG: hypothetical protein IJ463_04670 [Bacilli bacterium]|nr:hypothetical protein [Bacilli bacterium]